MPRGVNQALLDDAADIVRQPVARPVIHTVQLQLHAHTPEALEPVNQLAQVAAQACVWGHQAEGAELGVANEDAQVALLVDDEPLDRRQSVARRPGVRVPQTLHRLELQGRPGQRLQHAVVQVPKQPDALLGSRGLAYPPGQQRLINRGRHFVRDDLTEQQVIPRHARLVERKEVSAQAFTVHRQAQHGRHGEPRP